MQMELPRGSTYLSTGGTRLPTLPVCDVVALFRVPALISSCCSRFLLMHHQHSADPFQPALPSPRVSFSNLSAILSTARLLVVTQAQVCCRCLLAWKMCDFGNKLRGLKGKRHRDEGGKEQHKNWYFHALVCDTTSHQEFGAGMKGMILEQFHFDYEVRDSTFLGKGKKQPLHHRLCTKAWASNRRLWKGQHM